MSIEFNPTNDGKMLLELRFVLDDDPRSLSYPGESKIAETKEILFLE